VAVVFLFAVAALGACGDGDETLATEPTPSRSTGTSPATQASTAPPTASSTTDPRAPTRPPTSTSAFSSTTTEPPAPAIERSWERFEEELRAAREAIERRIAEVERRLAAGEDLPDTLKYGGVADLDPVFDAPRSRCPQLPSTPCSRCSTISGSWLGLS
jgi:hypothetical protein